MPNAQHVSEKKDHGSNFVEIPTLKYEYVPNFVYGGRREKENVHGNQREPNKNQLGTSLRC